MVVVQDLGLYVRNLEFPQSFVELGEEKVHLAPGGRGEAELVFGGRLADAQQEEGGGLARKYLRLEILALADFPGFRR